jgi:ABC-2 type transport system ATP-binding protein
MRLILGLDKPTSGSVTVNGRRYVDLPAPLGEVGALLEARAVHTSRSAYNHLRALGATHGIPTSRIDELIDLVGLRDVARRRVGSFSLGMGQRLGIAAALLGDPDVIILDEPVNGLDPEGIRWVRDLLHHLAGEGRTVFVSSHLMNEMAVTAEHVIVIGRGRLIADLPIADLIARSSGETVRVRTPNAAGLTDVLSREPATVTTGQDGVLEVHGMTAARIGELAAQHSLVLHELTPVQASLEEVFMELTQESVEFRSHAPMDAGVAS